MSILKKTIITLASILGVFLFLIILLFFWLRSFPDLCAETLISELPSPNKKTKVVVFQIDCGATTGFNTHASIIPIGNSPLKKSKNFIKPKIFFSADTNKGKAPSKKGHGPEIQLFWESDNNLKLKHHINARVFNSKKQSNGVTVEYHTFQ